MNLLESATQRDRVKRLIVDPLEGRGEPPRGWTKEAMLADYVLSLADYPEEVLTRAAAMVRAEHTRSSWPLAGEFRKACEKCGGKPETSARSTHPEAERVRVSVAAYAYVTSRMEAGDGALLVRSIRGGWQRECRRWLFDCACDAIRNSNEPHVPNVDLEERIADWEIDATARRQSQERLAAPRPVRPLSDLQRQFVASAPLPERRSSVDVDLDEEIPLPRSEDDYGVGAPAD